MALQVWLPLNGDLRNQGLSPVTITNSGATVDNNGKIGKCYYFNGNSEIITSSVDTSSWTNYSICCWIKADSTISDGTWHRIGGVAEHTFFQLDMSNKDVARFFISQDGTTSGIAVYATNSIVDGSWHHICGIADNTKIALYIDGELIGTTIRTIIYCPKSAIVRVGNTYSGSKFKGLINDFRIYDHALSIKEVKELAKGLILHYPLNNNGIGNLNILSDFDTSFQSYNNGATTLFTNQMNNGTQEIVSNIGGINGKCLHLHSSGGNNRQYRTKSLEQGKTYTISADYYSLNAQSTAWRGELNGGNYSWVGNNAAYTTPGKWQRLSYTYTNLTSNAIIYFFIYCTQGQDCYIKNIKIEEGESSTPWCPYFVDSNMIEYDCSGFNNNGIKNGIIKYTSDTPRYRVSSNFPSGANYINAGRGAMVTDAITVNLWMKCSTWGNVTSCTEGGGWNFEESNGLRFPIYTTDNTYRIAQSSITSASLKNNWHMLTGTYDGLIAKIYIDGEEKGSIVCSTTHKDIKYHASNVIFIGAEAANNVNTPANNNYIGNISDYRIYCTALSADDIKALYEDVGYIDNQGNFHVYEYSEF